MDDVDRNRLGEFRQLKQEIRHSEQYLIVGIDVAKDRHHVFFGTATGKTLLRKSVFDNTYEGFRKLLDQTEAIRVQHGLSKVAYGMEPTANYHKPFSEGLSIVKGCLAASDIAQSEVDSFVERVTSGRIRTEKRRRLEAIWEKAAESIGCEPVPGLDHEAKVMVEGLRQIGDMLREPEQKIQELCKTFPQYPYLLTIPGFGPDVSAKVMGAVGDPDRFLNGRQVLKLAGLDLSADRSGKNSDEAIPEFSKRGKGDLRYALYQAALIASMRNSEFMRYCTTPLSKTSGIR